MQKAISTGRQSQCCNPDVWGGIECTINRVGDKFFDQLHFSNHYSRTEDIERIAELGISKMRYPVLWERHEPASDTAINWDWIEKKLKQFQHYDIDVIAGLVHHGSGPAYTNLSDGNFPILLAQYAKKVAAKFPWLKYYTPVNEPLTTARFSGLYGIWYPHETNDKAFITMLLNQLKGVVLSMNEIRKINPEAKLIQTEDLGKTYSSPILKYQAEFENERRWLTYDLLCGAFSKDHLLWDYLKWLKISEKDLYFFEENNCKPDILGFNYYITSERYIDDQLHLYPEHTHGGNLDYQYADVEAARVKLDEETGVEGVLKEAWERYSTPMVISEVHLHCHREEQLRWFEYVWTACKKLAGNGVNIQGVTAWALLGSYGWNKLLTRPRGNYEPGVFDVRDGTPRPTALANYIKQLTQSGKCSHPVIEEKGWWERDSRILYQAPFSTMEQKRIRNKNTQPVLIVGKRGTLGRAFAKICEQRCISYRTLGRNDCDIADMNTINSVINLYKPWAIINAAGYVRVDDAEEEEAEQCFRENTFGAQNLSVACKQHGIKLVTFSTDLVFDGNKRTPYVESDAVCPLNAYGRSKAESEKLVLENDPSSLVIRTSAFFGPWDEYNFVHWVIQNLEEHQSIPVASDVYVSPTYVPDLVHATLDLLIDDEKNIWHLTNKGQITWANLAFETARQLDDADITLINAIPLADMNLSAPRPMYSVLSSCKGILLPALDNALQRFFQEKQHAMYIAEV
ncbi:MAG: family 1 glycosylhydrolase [Chitinophagaceae bacterium]